MLTLRLVYENTILLAVFLWLFMLATSDEAKCPLESPMWQGLESNSATTLEVNSTHHPVSQLGSRITSNSYNRIHTATSETVNDSLAFHTQQGKV